MTKYPLISKLPSPDAFNEVGRETAALFLHLFSDPEYFWQRRPSVELSERASGVAAVLQISPLSLPLSAADGLTSHVCRAPSRRRREKEGVREGGSCLSLLRLLPPTLSLTATF